MTQNIEEIWQNAIAHHRSGRLEVAQLLYLQVLSQQPGCIAALQNLGAIACQSQQFAIAITYYKKALEIDPSHIDTHTNLGQAFQSIGNLAEAIRHYEKILALGPDRADIHYTLGKLLAQQERLDEAILHYQEAIAIQPDYIQSYLDLSDILVAKQQLEAARQYLQKAIELQPDCAEAYWNLCVILRQTSDFALWRQTVEQYAHQCDLIDAIGAAISLIQVYYGTGRHAKALQKLEKLELQVYHDTDSLSEQNIERLYFQILVALPLLRDDLEANSRFAKLIGSLYAKSVDLTFAKQASHHQALSPKDADFDRSYIHYYLRIGIVSANFRRHPVGWCSAGAIEALSKLTPFLYLYATKKFEDDNRTRIFEKIAARCNWRSDRWQQQKTDDFENLRNLIDEIESDKLDVLIDLDSLTVSGHPELLRSKPARLCVSWLGFDAPFISPDNYNLGDRHTHPYGTDNSYLETILRLPDVHIAVAGFHSLPIDVKAKRKSLGLRDKDIVYLCVAPSAKLNHDTIRAHCQILKSVPHSTLLYQCADRGADPNVIKSIYNLACTELNIDNSRIIFLPLADTEEEHRRIYAVADILLDSYPYNDISHTLEALWFNLPVVTLVGEQSFAKIGYSFLTTLGITAGIAHSWDEYVEWGIGIAQFPALRDSIRGKLIESKKPTHLSPLWNPNKLADDMYKLFEEIIAGQIDADPVHYFEMGNRFWQDGNIAEATRSYRQAVGMQPNYAEAWGNLGLVLHEQDKLDEAISYYQKSLELNPANSAVQSSLARASKAKGDFVTAIASYQKAIDTDPGNIHPYNGLGEIFIEQKKFNDALKCFQQAIAINPSYAFSHNRLGTVYLDLNQIDRAIHSFHQAIANDPSFSHAHVNLGFTLLLKGELSRGFVIYEWRRQCPDISNSIPTFSQPLWDGTDFAGKTLLIYVEQELDDAIQFIRYLPLVRARGGDRSKVLFDCPKSLNRLCSQFKGIILVERVDSLPWFDLRVPLSSLPRIFGTTLDSIPAARPYLFALTDSLIELCSDSAAQSGSAQLQVGVLWAASGDSSKAQKCSCPLILFRDLLNNRKAIFYSLQKEIPSEDIELFNSMIWEIVDLQDRLDDFADMADIIAQMDLVITIDTPVAHLAGAMGMPVWLLLPYAPDWRWMLEREDSPWYPSMRLFRQENIDDWQGAISRVAAALEELLWAEK
jgi:protein O-GlcNAc transferase